MTIHPQIETLISEIDAFVAKAGISPTAFGKQAINDPSLYWHLKEGRNPRFETLDRIRAFMRDREATAA